MEAYDTSPSNFPHIIVREPLPKEDFIPIDLVHQDKLLASTLVWNKQQWPIIVNGLVRMNSLNNDTVQNAVSKPLF